MPKINIDELVEPIEVTVGGKDYILADIPRDVAREMTKLGGKAEEIQDALSDVADLIQNAKDTGNLKWIPDLRKRMVKLVEEADNTDSTENLVIVMTKVLGAKKEDIAKLGMRKLTMLVKSIMETIGEELERKNVPKAKVTK